MQLRAALAEHGAVYLRTARHSVSNVSLIARLVITGIVIGTRGLQQCVVTSTCCCRACHCSIFRMRAGYLYKIVSLGVISFEFLQHFYIARN